jgi:hypothetical protein
MGMGKGFYLSLFLSFGLMDMDRLFLRESLNGRLFVTEPLKNRLFEIEPPKNKLIMLEPPKNRLIMLEPHVIETSKDFICPISCHKYSSCE